MPNIFVINQPFGGRPNRVGDHVIELLTRTPSFTFSCIAVAWAKASGVGILFDHFQDFVKGGGVLEVAVGVDQRGTSRQALDLLLQSGASTYIFHNPGGETFHPKLYLFGMPTEGVAIVGSSNLTRGGLYENFEFSTRLDHDLGDPSDAAAFASFVASFTTIKDISSGMALRLDAGVLSQLDSEGYLLDETHSPPRQLTVARTPGGGGNLLFRHVPMPRGPRGTRRVASAPAVPAAGIPTALFAMTLGARDTRQQAGYSRDIFIPIAARNERAAFWGWPGAFVASTSGAQGSYQERRVDLQVTPVTGLTRLVKQVRLYHYAERDEFRLNCGELVGGATAGDVLVLTCVQPGAGYDYDAAVIPVSHPMHSAFLNVCTHVIPQSGKRWGYG